MSRPLRILATVLTFLLPSLVSASDSAVYQCPDPSGTILYTNREQPDCRPMTLGTLTIAPTRTYSTPIDSPNYTPPPPFSPDWYDYTAPIGSMRNNPLQSYPPQDLSGDPNQPPLGFGRGPGYPYQRFGGRLGQFPQGFGYGPGYPSQNLGNGLDQPPPGSGGGAGQPSQLFGGATGHHPQSVGPGFGHSPQRFGGGPGHGTGHFRSR
jgi:hypothetical protein